MNSDVRNIGSKPWIFWLMTQKSWLLTTSIALLSIPLNSMCVGSGMFKVLILITKLDHVVPILSILWLLMIVVHLITTIVQFDIFIKYHNCRLDEQYFARYWILALTRMVLYVIATLLSPCYKHHLHHHYLPISFTKYRTSGDQDSALRGDIYIGKGTALLLPYLTIHLISSFSSSSPKSFLSPISSPSLCVQDPSSDPATFLLIYLLLLWNEMS